METYEEIYERMREAYCAESGFEIDDVSEIAIKLRVLAGEIYNAQVNFEWLKRQMFAATASGEYLDYLAMQRGLERKPALKAQGELTFYINEVKDHDVVIPIGTVVSTADEEPVRFVTTENEYIASGNTLVSVYAEAEQAGAGGNIGTYKAIVPVSVPAEVDSVTNRSPFEDGADEENDDSLRERIAATYKSPSNGTNAAFYENMALSVEGITKANVVGKVRGVGTVNVYVCNGGEAADDGAVQTAQELISKSRELNVDVKVIAANSQAYNFNAQIISKSGYTAEYVKSQCKQAFESCLASIPIGGTLYLSNLGKYLMETGCVENYVFDVSMDTAGLTASQFFVPGTFSAEVV